MSLCPRRHTRTLALGSLVLAGALCAGGAQAGSNVYWSINVGVPAYPVGIGAVIGNVAPPVVVPAPVYVAPAPVYLAPPAVVYAPPIVAAPRAVVVSPRPWAYAVPVYPGGKGRSWRHRDGHGQPHGVRYGD